MAVDLREREYGFAMLASVNLVHVYILVLDCAMLYTSLCCSLESIRCHSNCWNIVADGVVYSARRIMRAARFCNLQHLPMFVLDVDAHVMYP